MKMAIRDALIWCLGGGALAAGLCFAARAWFDVPPELGAALGALVAGGGLLQRRRPAPPPAEPPPPRRPVTRAPGRSLARARLSPIGRWEATSPALRRL